MKNSRIIFKLVLLLLASLPAMGFLPPDAEHRSREIIEGRQRQRDAYEARQVARRKRSAENEKKIRREMQHPPWRRSEAAMTASENGGAAARASIFKKEEQRSGWLAGFFGLLFIGGAALWIKQMTREADNR